MSRGSTYTTGIFLKRLNRFISEVTIDGITKKVYVPNTGRLSELAIPGNKVLLEEYSGKFRYKMKYIIHNGFPVMINSSLSNRLFEEILGNHKLSPFPDYSVARTEPKHGSHRFDFLIESVTDRKFIELKSCTLGYGNVASFPDAVSERASRHIRALSETDNSSVIFFVLLDNIDVFVPNFHTDFVFYETLKQYRDKIDIRAYGVKYSEDLDIIALKQIPVEIPEVRPDGIYSIVLHNRTSQNINVGSMGEIFFEKGYYIYTGSAKNSLFKRIAHHRNKSKKLHWHMDYIKHHMKIVTDTPIVTESVSECDLASSIKMLSHGEIKNFGSTDCRCTSHLFYFRDNPVESAEFWEIILNFRFSQYSDYSSK